MLKIKIIFASLKSLKEVLIWSENGRVRSDVIIPKKSPGKKNGIRKQIIAYRLSWVTNE